MDKEKLQFGLLEKTEDKRDLKPLGSVLSLPSLRELPNEYLVPPLNVIDQTTSDFCAAASTGNEKAVMENEQPFWPALFALAKLLAKKDPGTWGLEMREIYKAANYSVPMAKDAPTFLTEKLQQQDWDFLRRIENYPDDFIESGKEYRNKAFIDVWSPQYDAYDTVRAAMWKFRDEKRTVGIGVQFGWAITEFILDSVPKNGSGHKMSVFGWDLVGLDVPNTYGTKAGKNGHHRITRDVINHFADKYGLFMGVDMPVEDLKWYIENGIIEGDNWFTQIWKIGIKTILDFLATIF